MSGVHRLYCNLVVLSVFPVGENTADDPDTNIQKENDDGNGDQGIARDILRHFSDEREKLIGMRRYIGSARGGGQKRQWQETPPNYMFNAHFLRPTYLPRFHTKAIVRRAGV